MHDFPFEYDAKTTALIVEFYGKSLRAFELPHNFRWRSYVENFKSSDEDEYELSRELTPAADADEISGYMCLPFTTKHKAKGYVFGLDSRSVDVRLPQSDRKAISARHFRIYLSEFSTWMAENLSKNAIYFEGLLLRHKECFALHPERPNSIRVQGLYMNVYITHESVTCSQPENVQATPPTSVADSTSTASTQAIDDENDGLCILGSTETPYHICLTLPIGTGKPKYGAINTRTGLHCIAKLYEASDKDRIVAQYADLYLPAILVWEEAIPRMIITEYIECESLKTLLEEERIPNVPTLNLIFGQLASALACIHARDIIHNDLNPSVILFSANNQKATLTGFSSYVKGPQDGHDRRAGRYHAPEIAQGLPYNALADVYSFCSIFDECFLPLHHDPLISCRTNLNRDPAIDSLLFQGLSTTPPDRPSSADIESQLRNMIGGRSELPFQGFQVVRKRCIMSITADGKDMVRTSDIVDALASRGHDAARIRTSKYHNNEKYCLRRSARKLCHKKHLKEMEEHLRQKVSSPEDFINELHTVTYHAPSKMVNLSHLLRIANLKLEAVSNVISAAVLQEVRGLHYWDGTYIDYQTLLALSSFFNKHGVHYDTGEIVEIPNLVLSKRFTNTIPDQTIILVTEQFEYNMLHLRRLDGWVDWAPFGQNAGCFISLQESYEKCEQLELADLRSTLEELAHEPRTPQWNRPAPSHPNWDSDDSATSLESTESFLNLRSLDPDEGLTFKMKRKRSQ